LHNPVVIAHLEPSLLEFDFVSSKILQRRQAKIVAQVSLGGRLIHLESPLMRGMANKRGGKATTKTNRALRSNPIESPLSDEIGDMSDPGIASASSNNTLHRTNSLGQIFQPTLRTPPGGISGPMAHHHQAHSSHQLTPAANVANKEVEAPITGAASIPFAPIGIQPFVPEINPNNQLVSPRRRHVTSTDFAALLTIVQEQAAQMNHQFNFIVNNQNQQLAQQQDAMNTMRQEFMQNQRLIATELAQTRETFALNNQINRRNQGPQVNQNPLDQVVNQLRMQANAAAPPRGAVPRYVPPIAPIQVPPVAPLFAPLGQQQQIPLVQVAQPNPPVVQVGQNNVNGHGHNPTFHLKAMEIPHYAGAHENKTPYDFLIELDKYKTVSRSTDQFMTNEVAPLALQGQAFHWYRFEMSLLPFETYEDFKVRFRKEFQTLGYGTELMRELELRTQGPTEPLTQFIRIIVDFYKRLGQNPPEEEIVSRIKRQMHPEFMQALQGKVLNTVRDLMDAAFDAQDLIKAFRSYRPPPLAPGVEPSLQWKPLDLTPAMSRPSVNTFTSLAEKPNARLHPHGIDPYNFYHAERPMNRQVTFNNPQTGQSSRQNYENNRNNFPSRPNSPAPQTNQQQQNNNRPASPIVQQPSTPPRVRRCFDCDSPDHIRPCPLKSPTANRRSGNSPAPSPARDGLGRNA
jgi:hypothetical protein